MRRFFCKSCENEIYFDSETCVSCSSRVAFDPKRLDMLTLSPAENGDGSWTALADGGDAPQSYWLCENAEGAHCNWLVEAGASDRRCLCCRHNRTVPDLSIAGNGMLWTALESGKRALFYMILSWNLPHPTREEEPEKGLAFDFMADETQADGTLKSVLTGHADGLITINIAEGDDAEREQRRKQMGEPYRTLIGHFRHEVGHYYWDVLVRDGGRLDAFREIFGDERAGYGEALERHYESGPPADWAQSYISTYATAHPWEDFAETWAHYLHMTDAVETGRAYGIVRAAAEAHEEKVQSGELRNGYDARSAAAIINGFVPMTLAINNINRSMGQPDLYPFVLSEPVGRKLEFIHEIVHGGASA